MTVAKTVQVSTDDVTYYNLPGNTGEFNNEASSIDDTVFGQDFQSNESGLINWNVSAAAFYKGFAGYQAKLKKQGISTSMTGEAMSLVSGKTYKVTNAAKSIFNPGVALTVLDNAVDHTDDVIAIDYLYGTVTFDPGYTVTGPVTVTGAYFPTATLGKAQSYNLTQTAETIETTDFGTAQGNGGHRTFISGLKTVGLELTGFYDVTPGFRAALIAREVLIIEVDPSGTGKSIARGFFKLASEGQSGDVGALEEETITFNLQVPSSDYLPFNWLHANDTTLAQSVRICLNAWLSGELIYVKYLYDGTNGVKGECIVTEVSLSSGLDDMNEFSLSFQGSGETDDVGTG